MYIFILTGYSDKNGKDRIIQDAVYSTSVFLVDGVSIIGSNHKKYPINLLEKIRKELA